MCQHAQISETGVLQLSFSHLSHHRAQSQNLIRPQLSHRTEGLEWVKNQNMFQPQIMLMSQHVLLSCPCLINRNSYTPVKESNFDYILEMMHVNLRSDAWWEQDLNWEEDKTAAPQARLWGKMMIWDIFIVLWSSQFYWPAWVLPTVLGAARSSLKRPERKLPHTVSDPPVTYGWAEWMSKLKETSLWCLHSLELALIDETQHLNSFNRVIK